MEHFRQMWAFCQLACIWCRRGRPWNLAGPTQHKGQQHICRKRFTIFFYKEVIFSFISLSVTHWPLIIPTLTRPWCWGPAPQVAPVCSILTLVTWSSSLSAGWSSSVLDSPTQSPNSQVLFFQAIHCEWINSFRIQKSLAEIPAQIGSSG